jgi:hypothetical protein
MRRKPSPDHQLHYEFHTTTDNRLLYAESNDGIHWKKPGLDYRAIDGQNTNICFGDAAYGKIHACSVLLDPLETDVRYRYKFIYWTEKTGVSDSRIATAHSPDGRCWMPYDEPLCIGQLTEHQLSDVIKLTTDPVRCEYYLDTRIRGMQLVSTAPGYPTAPGWGGPYFPSDSWRMSKRRIYSSSSFDVNNWPVLKEILVPDDIEDGLDDEFYGLIRFAMGDLHVGLLNIFHRTHNTMNMHLVYSRDGYR